jgi:hypothetical protein
MGFFDLFKRKPKPEPEDDFPEEFLEQESAKIRCHHYTMAHVALRSVAFAQPLGFFGILASEEAENFLGELLESVTEECQERERRPDFKAADLQVHTGRVGNYPCVVIEMPEPRGTTEAFFVGAVLLVELAEDEEPPENPELRYFTLEKGMQMEEMQPRTVFCEWTAEGSHLNFGDGPPATVKDFTAAIEEHLAGGESE